MRSIPSFQSQSASPHTTMHSLASIDSMETQNNEKKKKSTGKKGKLMVQESSSKKNKQREMKRPKTSVNTRQRDSPEEGPSDTVIASVIKKNREKMKPDENVECNEGLISCLEFPSDLYRTMSKATLIDQESGEVYQLIENKRGTACETFLLHQDTPVSSSTPVHDFHGKTTNQGRGSDWTATKTRNLSELAGKGRADKSDLQLLIADQDSGSTSSVERFIAVPVSPTYLTDHIRSIQAANSSESPACTSLVSALVHAPCDIPPPTSERLSPIGANSRTTSKLSLDMLDDETKC